MNNYVKYLKYKNKYINLKYQLGGTLSEPINALPTIAFGSWYENPIKDIIINSWKCALENGYTVFDFASAYNSSSYINDFNRLVSELQINDEIYIIAKDLNPELFNLPNYKIIYTQHYGLFSFDEIRAIDDKIKQGKIFKYGIGNIYEKDLSKLQELLDYCTKNNLEKPYLNEIEITLLSPQLSYIDFLISNNIIPVGYMALRQPILLNEEIMKFKTDNEITEHKTILSYLRSRKITVIATSTKCDHIKENLNYIEINDIQLSNMNKNYTDKNWEDIFIMMGN